MKRSEARKLQSPEGAAPARVTHVSNAREVRLEMDETERPALVAMGGAYAPAVGDTVLALTARDGSTYVIGVLEGRHVRGVGTADGVRASVERVETGGEVLRVRARDGALLFEHDATTGCTVLGVPTGDLELRAETGSVRISAAHHVDVRAGQHLGLEGGRTVRLGTDAETASAVSSVTMDARGMHVTSERLHTVATRTDTTVDHATLTARTVESTVETLRQVVGVLETRASRIVSRAKNFYTEVEELAQTHAGRVRMVATDTFHVLGRRTLFKAREDMKLKGDKIHLA